MAATLHLLKLCVGADGIEDLIAWQADRMAERRAAGPRPLPVPRHPHVAAARGRRAHRRRLALLGLQGPRARAASASSASSRAAATTASSAAPSASTPRWSAPCRSRAGRSRAGATSAPRTRRAISWPPAAGDVPPALAGRARPRSECSDMRRARPRPLRRRPRPPPRGPAAGAQRSKYNWDALGAEFCRLTLAGDLAGLRPLLSDVARRRTSTAAASNPELMPPQVLFQTYTNVVAGLRGAHPQRRDRRDPPQQARRRRPVLDRVSRHRPRGRRHQPHRRRALRHPPQRHPARPSRLLRRLR